MRERRAVTPYPPIVGGGGSVVVTHGLDASIYRRSLFVSALFENQATGAL